MLKSECYYHSAGPPGWSSFSSPLNFIIFLTICSVFWKISLTLFSNLYYDFFYLFYCCCCYCLGPDSCPTLCDPMDCSLPGSSVHGISQARILEWVAISFSMGSSLPRDQTPISCISCIGRHILYCCITWEPRCGHYTNTKLKVRTWR